MKKKFEIRIDEKENGVTIWVNGTWVMDASLFKQTMEFSVNKERMKVVKNYECKNRLRFRYDGRTK